MFQKLTATIHKKFKFLFNYNLYIHSDLIAKNNVRYTSTFTFPQAVIQSVKLTMTFTQTPPLILPITIEFLSSAWELIRFVLVNL